MHTLWHFTEEEKHDLLLSWVLVSLAFALASHPLFSSRFFWMLPVAGITVGLGFVLHELGHRIVARHFGFEAHYRVYKQGLYLGIFLAFLGIIFLAPGAVLIKGYIAKKEHGKIALAGPLMNLFLGVIFFLLQNTFLMYGLDIFAYGASINFFLAFFNLLPFGPLDGKVVYAWDKKIYGITVLLALAGVFFTSI